MIVSHTHKPITHQREPYTYDLSIFGKAPTLQTISATCESQAPEPDPSKQTNRDSVRTWQRILAERNAPWLQGCMGLCRVYVYIPLFLLILHRDAGTRHYLSFKERHSNPLNLAFNRRMSNPSVFKLLSMQWWVNNLTRPFTSASSSLFSYFFPQVKTIVLIQIQVINAASLVSGNPMGLDETKMAHVLQQQVWLEDVGLPAWHSFVRRQYGSYKIWVMETKGHGIDDSDGCRDCVGDICLGGHSPVQSSAPSLYWYRRMWKQDWMFTRLYHKVSLDSQQTTSHMQWVDAQVCTGLIPTSNLWGSLLWIEVSMRYCRYEVLTSRRMNWMRVSCLSVSHLVSCGSVRSRTHFEFRIYCTHLLHTLVVTTDFRY